MILDLRAAVRELYGVAPADFIARRKQLAAQAKAGDAAALAAEVMALRKPTVSAWALNHFTRVDEGLLDAFHAFAEDLREAQRTLDADQLRTLGRERSARVDQVATAVALAAAEQGQKLTAATLLEVQDTLVAALADEAAEQAVRSGSLVKALSYSGFGSVDIDGAAILPVDGVDVDVADEPIDAARAPSVGTRASVVTDEGELNRRRAAKEEARRQAQRARLVAAIDRADVALAKAERQHEVAATRAAEAREGIADLERRLATAKERHAKASAEADELGGIVTDRRSERQEAVEALERYDAQED